MTKRNPAINNPYNQILQARREALSNATRSALVPANCQTAAMLTPQALTRQERSQLLEVTINCNTAGDNQLIPTLTGKKLIYEIVIWNVAAQTLALFQGPSATGILKLRLTSFPALTGFTLGFNGSYAQPHFEIDGGQPFVLNLAASTQVDGMIRYKISSGSTDQ